MSALTYPELHRQTQSATSGTGSGPAAILLCPEHNDFADEVERQRLIQGKFHGALGTLIGGQLLLEMLDSAGRGVKAKMVFKSGKVDQVAVQGESGNRVVDGFFRFGTAALIVFRTSCKARCTLAGKLAR